MSESLLRNYFMNVAFSQTSLSQTKMKELPKQWLHSLCSRCIQGTTIVLTYIIVPWTLTRPT